MTLTLLHRGRTRHLAKHPNIVRKLKLGLITESQARATRWFLRLKLNGREQTFKLDPRDEIARSMARDILNARTDLIGDFAAFLAAREAARGLALGALATEWLALGCPYHAAKFRSPASAGYVQKSLARALPWWRDHRLTAITQTVIADYVASRQPHLSSAEHELCALSSLCRWAVLTDRLKKNPFVPRPRFQSEEHISHCTERMPETDDQFHAVLRWLWRDQSQHNRVIAGAWLAFTGLSGLRPSEPKFLQLVPDAAAFPSGYDAAPIGLRYPTPDGQEQIKVRRMKVRKAGKRHELGHNPAILVRPVLASFLDVWTRWHKTHLDSPLLFPTNYWAVHRYLTEASAALGLPHYGPHGFGRAYYVRVRRSQGADCATIAAELGQRTLGEEIWSVYADPRDPIGGNLHDWLPASGPPAWELLQPATASNLIAL